MQKTIRRGAAIALLLVASVVANAAGLGKLTVNSSLGQPLNAEIDLVSLQPGELESLQARVAPPEAFREAQIEYGPSLRLLRFSVEKRPSGQPYLKVTSVAPINEPFVDVLVEVTWPAGRIQREYPILLDPPGYSQARVTPPAAAPAAAPRMAEVKPEAAKPAAVAPTGAPSARGELVGTAGGDTYGPVQRGDTLSKIANQVKPADVSLEQMLVALYRENQGAFVNNNMNRLKAGQILKVPAADEVARVETKEARQEVRTHVADWRAYREQLASGATSLPARTETSSSASGRVTTAAVTPPPAPAAEPKDVLKLSKSETAKGAAPGKGGAGAANVTALQEELAAKDRALREAQSRVADLEKQVRDMQRLLDLKAGAPAKAEPPKVATTPAAPVKAEPPKVAEVKPAEAPKAAAPAKPEPPKVAEAPKTEPAKPAEAPKVAEAPKPAPPKPAAAPKKPPPPPPSMMDEILENPLMLAGGIAALALIGVGGFIAARRRKARAEAGPTSSMTSAFPSDLKPATTTGKPASGLVDTGNSSFLTDFDKTGPSSLDTDEVDPVAEAEVYIAYGRDVQAEEILKEALARDKGRPEIALKLLEIYHARKSATAFEKVAKEFRESVGESHPMWQKAAAMGAQIDPNNPLYAGASPAAAPAPAAPAPAKPDLDFDITPSAQASAAEPSFDLDLDTKKPSSASAEPAGDSHVLDFDIEGTPSTAPAPAAIDVTAEPPKEEKPSFDFDLSSLDMPATGKPAEPAKPAAAASQDQTMTFDLADLSLDTPAASGGDAASSEAAGTKLELAKAYLEIGDKDGAREILQEVAKEGSSAQKEEAKKLIASL